MAASVVQLLPELRFSVSYTTRAARGTELNGVEYHFVDQTRFAELIGSGELLEYALVYGNYYGTSRKFIDECLSRGEDVLLDVDVQGAQTIRQRRPDSVSIFIMPPSYQVLRERLESRKLDKDYIIEQRLKIAGKEIRHYKNYDYLIINQELDKSIEEMTAIILGSRCRSSSRADYAKSIVATFGGTDAEDP